MRFALILHSHMPWVLGHGRWPHGSDWLVEAALDSYLPLLAWLDRAETAQQQVGLTLGVTPVLAAQLAEPTFARELEAYFAHRHDTLQQTAAALRDSGDDELAALIPWWTDRLRQLEMVWHRHDHNILAALRHHRDAGRIELISSAATHGFLPLLGRDESIRLQLLVGRAEHLRHFGVLPQGCWVPECAYRPGGQWQPLPDGPHRSGRPALEAHLRHAGFRWFVVDAHLAQAGSAWELYGSRTTRPPVAPQSSPYRSWEVGHRSSRERAVDLVIRDPETTTQVWSRHGGYPGDPAYLEFHKLRYPGGLKLWRVTDPRADLGAKQPYQPTAAAAAARSHADHFHGLLSRIAADAVDPDQAIVAPFDTELFGHWWFEGIDFLEALYQRLATTPTGPRPTTVSRHLSEHQPEGAIELSSGSWGAGGDFSMWLNDETAWTWRRLWPLEDRFWNAVPRVLEEPGLRRIIEQAARELLLAQSSDWQFIISTGAAGDYASQRFTEHCDALERLLPAIEGWGDRADAEAEASRLRQSDGLFPQLIGALAAASDLPATE